MESVAYWYTRSDGIIISVLPGVGGKQREHSPEHWPSGRLAYTLVQVDPPPQGDRWFVNGGVWQRSPELAPAVQKAIAETGGLPEQRNPIRRNWWDRLTRRIRRFLFNG